MPQSAMSENTPSFTKENADLIIRQLAGHQGKLIAFTGAKDFLFSSKERFVSFSIGTGAQAINGKAINYVKITLRNDLYDVEFGHKGMEKEPPFNVPMPTYAKLETLEGVFAENLREVFESTTGFYLSF